MIAMGETENIATRQTGQMSKMMAYQAQDAAKKAMAAYMVAQKASDDAAAAMTVEAATEAKLMAEEAQADAAMHADTASEKSKGAVKYAMTELMIDGKDKSVGASMLNAGDGELTVTSDDGEMTTITGRMMSMDPMNMIPAKVAVDGAQDNEATDATDEAVTGMAAVAARSVTIGRTLDSRDDMARLLLVTHHADSKMVKVFDYLQTAAEATDGTTDITTTTASIEVDAAGGAPANTSPLVYKGMYYLAMAAAAEAATSTDGLANPTADAATLADNIVAAGAEPMRVYAYASAAGTDNIWGTDDDTITNVVLHSSLTTGGTTTRTYRTVDITVTLAEITGTYARPAMEAPLMADISQAVAYDHLHFGVWANLGDAEDDGSQELDDLGIGFVQSIGDGMATAMPNHESATYEGDWVAAIQEADGGPITLDNGTATLTANLNKSTLTANLMGLATLTGTLTGTTFEGTKAAIDEDNAYGLNADGTFTGTFSGGFYGADALEAGGIFDFTSKDIVDGAFRGALGGHRTDPYN